MNIFLPNESQFHVMTFENGPEALLIELEKNNLQAIPTTTGLISEVRRENNSYDWNTTSEDFYFHQDGSHLPTKPEYVALLCKHPGDANAITSFTDARKIYTSLTKEFSEALLESLVAVYIDRHKNIFRRPFVEKNVHNQSYVNTFHYLEPNIHTIQEEDRRMFNIILPKLLSAYTQFQNEYIFYKHTFKKDDLIIFKNQDCHHSKTGMSKDDIDRFLYRLWFTSKK